MCARRAQSIRMHLSIFLGMTCVLLVLIIWFIRELAKAPKPGEGGEKAGKAD